MTGHRGDVERRPRVAWPEVREKGTRGNEHPVCAGLVLEASGGSQGQKNKG